MGKARQPRNGSMHTVGRWLRDTINAASWLRVTPVDYAFFPLEEGFSLHRRQGGMQGHDPSSRPESISRNPDWIPPRDLWHRGVGITERVMTGGRLRIVILAG